MVRTLALAAALGLAATTAAAAQTAPPRHRIHRVATNGRCNGVSYGTGARSCGTRTGGPVGGLTSRN